ncbi:hypothetical protein JST97_30365 [bacterium]|nr:hypothetical protein [bacterium]
MSFDRRLTRIKWGFLLVLLAVPLRLVALQVLWRDQLNSDPHNSRTQERLAYRGRILDRHGALLACSHGERRVYPQGQLTAHWTGFCSPDRGVAGAERWKTELLRERREDGGKTSRRGHDLRLSLDLGLQRRLLGYFPNLPGAALLIDLDRAQVLAAVSEPGFQPARVGRDWRKWQSDSQAPLLNRAFLGVYPAGALATSWDWKRLPRRPVLLMDWTEPQVVKGQLLISPVQLAYRLVLSGGNLPLSQLFNDHPEPWHPAVDLAPLVRCAGGWQWSCVARLEKQVVTWAVAVRPPYAAIILWENTDKQKAALEAAWKSLPSP